MRGVFMRQVAGWLGKGLRWTGALLAIAISVPLLAAFLVLLRPILVVVAIASLVALPVLALCSPRFREWYRRFCQQPVRYDRHQGLRLTEDIALDRCHSWSRMLGRRVNIGVDDLIQFTLGPVEKVELPRVGTRCRRGEPLFVLHRGGRVLQVRAPMSGTVEAVNTQLRDFPGLINQTPFTEGWAVCMRPEDGEHALDRLLHGRQAGDWFHSEVDRLVCRLTGCETTGPTLPDGGELAGDLHNQISDRDWQTIAREFFETPLDMNGPVHSSSSV